MGYQDGEGLRPGRSVKRLQTDIGAANQLGTSRISGGNYRTAGAISPIRSSQTQDTGMPVVSPPVTPASTVSPQGSALFQYSASDFQPAYQQANYSLAIPKMPEPPGIGKQIALGVGGKLAGEAVSKGVGSILDSFSAPSATYNLTTAPDYTGTITDNVAGSVSGLTIPSGFDIAPGITSGAANLAATTDLWTTPSYGLSSGTSSFGLNPASSGFGLKAPAGFDIAPSVQAPGISEALPYAGSAIKLLQGDVGGAAKTAAGTAIGTAVGGPIGGAVGSVLGGGSVICTELARCKEVTPYQLAIEMSYASTVSKTVLRGYRYWAVPVVKLMRRNPTVYRIARAIGLRFMQESRARLGYGKQTLLGITVIPVCYAACWMIGLIVKDVDFNSLFDKETK